VNIHFVWFPPALVEHPRHEHDRFEILYCEEGSGYLEIDGQTIAFEPGHVMCIPPNMPHYDYSDVPRVNCIVQIDKQNVPNYQDFRVFRDSTGDFGKLFHMGFRIQLLREPNSERLLSAIGETMLQLLASWGYSGRKTNPAVENLRQAILERFYDPNFDPVEEIRKSGYNPNYFRRLFKDSTGLSPLAYLQRCRISYAKTLLTDESMGVLSVQEVAQRVGYNDQFYFTRIFKQLEDMSPRVYRQKFGSR